MVVILPSDTNGLKIEEVTVLGGILTCCTNDLERINKFLNCRKTR